VAKLLVTGGAGYIGSHTTHFLLERGHDVIVVDNLSRGHRHNVDEKRLRVLNLTYTEALEKLFREEQFDAVIHFAALIAVGESTAQPEFYFSNNLSGTISLLTAMAASNVRRLVFSSSAAVYGSPAEVPVGEEASFAPVSPYGETKAMAEKLLGWLDQCKGVRSIALRYFNACGAEAGVGLGEEHEPETHLIPLLFRAIHTGEPITIFGDDYDTPDGSCIRDYVHVSDLASAHVLAVESLLNGGRSDAFNVGVGTGYSVFEVLRAVEQVTGKKPPYRVGPRRAGDPPELVANSNKIRQVLGWRPRYTSLNEIVDSAWRFETVRLAGADRRG
jgi:UDP-glucose-4-epimerase GalE